MVMMVMVVTTTVMTTMILRWCVATSRNQKQMRAHSRRGERSINLNIYKISWGHH